MLVAECLLSAYCSINQVFVSVHRVIHSQYLTSNISLKTCKPLKVRFRAHRRSLQCISSPDTLTGEP